MPKSAVKNNRLLTLDYLRGFFILVIIIDHLARWPSLLAIISGQALLWVTAAEGFVAISGLLVGYVRGFKNAADSMATVTKKILKRAGLLYLWSIIASIGYTALIWYVPLEGGAPGIPIEQGQWGELISQIITLHYTFVWVHFLTLYAIFLAVSPIAVWLLRKGMAWLVILLSLVTLVIGWATHIEALQWQVLFFIPSVAGFYLPRITAWWSSLKNKQRKNLTVTTIGLTVTTLALSIICTFFPASIQDLANNLNGLFAKDTISVTRVVVAFLWFTGFILIFSRFQKQIGKAFGWLLLPFGTHSLTAYILHGLVICLISYVTVATDNFFINSVLGIICALLVLGLVQSRFVQKIVPS